MKSYPRVARALQSIPWAILPGKLADIEAFLTRVHVDGPLTPEAVQEQFGSVDPRPLIRVGSVAVIPIQGVISQKINMVDNLSGPGGTSTEMLTRHVQEAVDDKAITTILLDIDSPGGSVFGIQELVDVLMAARDKKRVVASINSVAASAAYWLAACANEIVVAPSGMVGSIGVFQMHEDVSKAAEMEGVKVSFIQAGKYKTEGNPYEPLSADAQAALQAQVNDYYDIFVKAVAKGRGVSQAAVRSGYGEGRMVRAADAVKQGMADRVGTFDATLGRLLVRGARKGGAAAALTTVRDFEAFLRDEGSLSNSEAKRVASLAFKDESGTSSETEAAATAQTTDGEDQETLQALREFNAAMGQ